MMNFETIIANVKAMMNNNTVEVNNVADYTVIEFVDFIGFGENGTEIMNNAFDYETADKVFDMIYNNTTPIKRNYLEYRKTVDNKLIYVTYSSNDI